MMKRLLSDKTRFYVLTAVLALIGISLTVYKNQVLGFPLLTDSTVDVWTVEAHIEFEPTDKTVKVSLAIPDNQSDLTLYDETFTTRHYSVEVVKDIPHKEHRRIIWKADNIKGRQDLFYRVSVYQPYHPEKQKRFYEEKTLLPPLSLTQEEMAAMDGIIEAARAVSGKKTVAFVTAVLRLLDAETPSNEVLLLLDKKATRRDKILLARNILARAGIYSVVARGFVLDTSKKRQKLTSVLCVGDKEQWHFFTLSAESFNLPERFLFWQRGGNSLLDVVGGKDIQIILSVLKEQRAASVFAVDSLRDKHSPLVTMSLYSLPIEQQSAFERLLMIPLGALIVVIIRNMIGIPTSGTFMPILIALAFLETRVLPGIVLFILIVSTGLMIRSYPRISAVLIVVVFIMAVLSILSNKIGVRQGLTVTLFPMIVLSWTIERLCVLWEEQGHKEVLIRGGGSLLVAVVAYLAMADPTAQHLMFTFPELMLVVLSVVLLLGRYSGYRLSELIRFRAFEETNNA